MARYVVFSRSGTRMHILEADKVMLRDHAYTLTREVGGSTETVAAFPPDAIASIVLQDAVVRPEKRKSE